MCADAAEHRLWSMPEGARRLLFTVATLALAAVVVFGLATPSRQDRLAALSDRVACPVCNGQSIADSPARTAREMRAIAADKLAAGESEDDIIEFFVAAYGESVVIDAPPTGRTLPLWIAPTVVMVGGLGLMATRLRRNSPP